jgi:hypothetical protein
VPGVPREAAKACPTSVSRSAATKLDWPTLGNQARLANAWQRSHQSTSLRHPRSGHAFAVAAKTGTMSRLDCQDLGQITPLAPPGPFGLVDLLHVCFMLSLAVTEISFYTIKPPCCDSLITNPPQTPFLRLCLSSYQTA